MCPNPWNLRFYQIHIRLGCTKKIEYSFKEKYPFFQNIQFVWHNYYNIEKRFFQAVLVDKRKLDLHEVEFYKIWSI